MDHPFIEDCLSKHLSMLMARPAAPAGKCWGQEESRAGHLCRAEVFWFTPQVTAAIGSWHWCTGLLAWSKRVGILVISGWWKSSIKKALNWNPKFWVWILAPDISLIEGQVTYNLSITSKIGLEGLLWGLNMTVAGTWTLLSKGWLTMAIIKSSWRKAILWRCPSKFGEQFFWDPSISIMRPLDKKNGVALEHFKVFSSEALEWTTCL